MPFKSKEDKNAYLRSWYKNHPEKLREKRLKDQKKPKTVFNDFRRAAKKRGHLFELNYEQFEKITKEPCFYCGDPGSNRINRNGIDRKDNDKDYLLNNSVSCCGMCNTMKRTYRFEDFINKCKQIVENRERMETP